MTRPRILLVEDNEANIYLARFLLEKAGYCVVVAENGLECLAVVESQLPDLIVMDLQMPIMDGYEAARRLKEDPGTASIPMIASSAYAQAGDRERALEAGFDTYISKPFDTDNFVAQVRAMLPPAEK